MTKQENKKRKIITIIIILAIIVTIFLILKSVFVELDAKIIICLILIFMLSLCFPLLCQYKEYTVGKHIIGVYAGVYDHFLQRDGRRVDEYKSSFYLAAINLSGKTDGISIDVKITPSNKITVKVDGNMIYPD